MFQICSPRQGAAHPPLPATLHLLQGAPLPFFRPLSMPLPRLPGLHCSVGLATRTHSSTARHGHPTTAARVIFATCNSDHVILRETSQWLFFVLETKKQLLSMAPESFLLPIPFPQLPVVTHWFHLPCLYVSPSCHAPFALSLGGAPILAHFAQQSPVHPVGLSPQSHIREALSVPTRSGPHPHSYLTTVLLWNAYLWCFYIYYLHDSLTKV